MSEKSFPYHSKMTFQTVQNWRHYPSSCCASWISISPDNPEWNVQTPRFELLDLFETTQDAVSVPRALRIGNGHFNFHTRLNADGSDLLDDLRRAVQVNQTLVDTHLETIPGLGTFTAWSLASGDTQDLGGHTHWPLHFQALVLGTTDQISTHWDKRNVVKTRNPTEITLPGTQ